MLCNERLDVERHAARNRVQRRRAARTWQMRRRSLQLVLEKTFGLHGEKPSDENLCYYQGIHDVFTVLLLVVGTSTDKGAVACACADAVLCHFLKDSAATTFDSVVYCLQTIFPLVASVDPEVGSALADSGVDPTVCLSWLITWFSHDIESPFIVERLFDAMLSSHPAFVLFLCSALILRRRSDVLAANAESPGDFSAMHCALAQMPKSELLRGTAATGEYNCEEEVEAWLLHARNLMLRVPPNKLPYLPGVKPEAKTALTPPPTFSPLQYIFRRSPVCYPSTSFSHSETGDIPILVQRELPGCVAARVFESDGQLLQKYRDRLIEGLVDVKESAKKQKSKARNSRNIRFHRHRAKNAGHVVIADTSSSLFEFASVLRALLTHPATAVAMLAVAATVFMAGFGVAPKRRGVVMMNESRKL